MCLIQHICMCSIVMYVGYLKYQNCYELTKKNQEKNHCHNQTYQQKSTTKSAKTKNIQEQTSTYHQNSEEDRKINRSRTTNIN